VHDDVLGKVLTWMGFRMPPARAAVSVALVAALVVCAIALATIATGERNRVELSPSFKPPATPPKVYSSRTVCT